MLPLNIQQQVYIDQIQSPHILRQKMNAIYGLSPVEERLLTVKTIFNAYAFTLQFCIDARFALKKRQKTYNSRDSLVVTHPTTNRPACGLSTAERTGSPVSHTLWSYVPAFWLKGNISGWVCLFSEILFLICRKLEITDMVQVAPTCQLFLAIARPLLYQTIDVSLVS